MKQIATALNLYYDKLGKYPDVPEGQNGLCVPTWQLGNTSNPEINFLEPLVAEGFFSKVPVETYLTPSNNHWDGCGYRYRRAHRNTGLSCAFTSEYIAVLYAYLENPRPSHIASAPACIAQSWRDGGSNDPYGYALFFPE